MLAVARVQALRPARPATSAPTGGLAAYDTPSTQAGAPLFQGARPHPIVAEEGLTCQARSPGERSMETTPASLTDSCLNRGPENLTNIT